MSMTVRKYETQGKTLNAFAAKSSLSKPIIELTNKDLHKIKVKIVNR